MERRHTQSGTNKRHVIAHSNDSISTLHDCLGFNTSYVLSLRMRGENCPSQCIVAGQVHSLAMLQEQAQYSDGVLFVFDVVRLQCCVGRREKPDS